MGLAFTGDTYKSEGRVSQRRHYRLTGKKANNYFSALPNLEWLFLGMIHWTFSYVVIGDNRIRALRPSLTERNGHEAFLMQKFGSEDVYWDDSLVWDRLHTSHLGTTSLSCGYSMLRCYAMTADVQNGCFHCFLLIVLDWPNICVAP